MKIPKLGIKEIIGIISSLIGIIAAVFAAYFYLENQFLSKDEFEFHKEQVKIKFIEIDYNSTEHELEHLLKIPEDQLTLLQKSKIEMLQNKLNFLESNLPW